MAVNLGSIYATIRARRDKFKGDLKAAEGDAKTAASRIQNSFSGISFQSLIIGVGAASFALKGFVDAASDLQEARSKFDVVFDGITDKAEKMVTVLTDSYMMSEQQARSFLSAIQDLLVPMGFAEDAAIGMSEKIVKLAADLASFNNMRIADVFRDIQSALVGNHETVQKYGVVLSQATVQQRAMADTGKENAKQLTAAEKAAARLNIVLKSTEKAHGDVARTSGEYANQVRKLQAQMKDFKAAVGQYMLPPLTSIVEYANKSIKALGELAAMIKKDFRSLFPVLTEADKLMQQYISTIEVLEKQAKADLFGNYSEQIKLANAALRSHKAMYNEVGESAEKATPKVEQLGAAGVATGEKSAAATKKWIDELNKLNKTSDLAIKKKQGELDALVRSDKIIEERNKDLAESITLKSKYAEESRRILADENSWYNVMLRNGKKANEQIEETTEKVKNLKKVVVSIPAVDVDWSPFMQGAQRAETAVSNLINKIKEAKMIQRAEAAAQEAAMWDVWAQDTKNAAGAFGAQLLMGAQGLSRRSGEAAGRAASYLHRAKQISSQNWTINIQPTMMSGDRNAARLVANEIKSELQYDARRG